MLLVFAAGVFAENYQSIETINNTDWVKYFDYLANPISNTSGDLNFLPEDMFLLYKTLPAGIPFTIKEYKLKEGEPSFDAAKISFLSDKEVEESRLMFKTYTTEAVVYPSLNLLFINVNGDPYVKVKAFPGPQDYKPTDAGEYKLLRGEENYLPFGAWMKKINGNWVYQKKDQWYKLPESIAADVSLPVEKRQYKYFDLNYDPAGAVVAARYAGNELGEYSLIWTADGVTPYPQKGFTPGGVLYSREILVKDLVYLLTVQGSDEFESCLEQNKNFNYYKVLYDFKQSKGQIVQDPGNPRLKSGEFIIRLSYYKLFNGLALNAEDLRLMDPKVTEAFKEYAENRLPRNPIARQEALGYYYYLKGNSLLIDAQARRHEKIKSDWEKIKLLRAMLRDDFDKMGVLSFENRQNLVEERLKSRLKFEKIAPPGEAKYVAAPAFSTFFKPEEENPVFTERERAVMVDRIRKALKGEDQKLDFNIVASLNNYNFGVLLNDILGDLYKSHGCLHVSPRNMILLYNLLPINTRMQVYPYSKPLSEEAFSGIPYLASLVNFKEDLDKMRENFITPEAVKVNVYPATGDWVIYLHKQPFARLTIKGGPQAKYSLVEGRDEKGRPVFEGNPAYSTTPGNYFVFRKEENYVSNLYYDLTIIPMGGVIKPSEGKWVFEDKWGKWRSLPKAVQNDLSLPEGKRDFTYYGRVQDASGEVVELKWGSHPFGRYALQTTVNHKTAWPELIHSSGDLMMEERQLINDLIKILTAPYDDFEECVTANPNFDLYRACGEFMGDPNREDLILPRERAGYRLHYNLPLTSEEAALLPPDVIIAAKIKAKESLTKEEEKILIDAGIAYRKKGKLAVNQGKVRGLQFDTYQYVVTIQKYARHYDTLKKRWGELSSLRAALLKDFNAFVLKDQVLFQNFMRELMLRRTRLERLSQQSALELLGKMLGNSP